MKYADREILVTVPFPDTVELNADVLNEHLISPYATGGGSMTSIYTQIDKDLQALVVAITGGETLMSLKPSMKTGKKAEVRFLIGYDPLQPLSASEQPCQRRAVHTWVVLTAAARLRSRAQAI